MLLWVRRNGLFRLVIKEKSDRLLHRHTYFELFIYIFLKELSFVDTTEIAQP
jgi:hypothetical protein